MSVDKKTKVKTIKIVYEFEVNFKINKTIKTIKEYVGPDYKKIEEIEEGTFKFRSSNLEDVKSLSHGILSLIKLGKHGKDEEPGA